MDVWPVISQMIPGGFEAHSLSASPGTAGRVLRVTVGVGTLFFVTYYQTMQLQSLLTSSAQAIDYTLDMLTDDLRSGRVSSLLVQG